jgi:hypothetical protein
MKMSMTKPVSTLASLAPKISTKGIALYPVTSGASRPMRCFWIAEVIRRRREPDARTIQFNEWRQ